MSLHWLGVFKYINESPCLGLGYLNIYISTALAEGPGDVTDRQTDTRTQPFIVKDNIMKGQYHYFFSGTVL